MYQTLLRLCKWNSISRRGIWLNFWFSFKMFRVKMSRAHIIDKMLVNSAEDLIYFEEPNL